MLYVKKILSLFNREISDKYIKLSIVTITISIIFIFVIFLLTIINPSIPLVKILFEVISAFGTVGLTMDLTSEYNGLTELIIVIVMLFGKVGLLTMARAFIPPRSPRKYHYSKDIFIF